MRTKLFFLVCFFALFLAKATYAAHIIGGQISYSCLGGGNYEITIKMYRDCYGGGALFDSDPQSNTVGQLTIYRDGLPVPFQSITLPPPVITSLEPNLNIDCAGESPDVCVEEGLYVFTVNLPSGPDSYHLTYQRCCRNNTITNIHDPGETGATYTVEITPAAQSNCNNSPVFKNFPPIAICAGMPLNFDHSATDVEGDSLVYEFCNPLKGGAINDVAPDPDAFPEYEPVDFVEPTYTVDRPLAGDPIVQIDPVTGIMSGVPEIIGQFVVGICVKEYRNGVLLSVIQRDFQFNVTPCDFTVTADLNGETTDGRLYRYETCEGGTIDMINESYELSLIDAYQWDFDMQDGNPIHTAATDLSLTFPNAGIYYGRMIVNPESYCTDTALVEVAVSPFPKAAVDGVTTDSLTFKYKTCEDGTVQMLNESYPVNYIESYKWEFDMQDGSTITSLNKDLNIPFPDAGTFYGHIIALPELFCADTALIEVEVLPKPIAVLDGETTDNVLFKYSTCAGGTVDMNNQSYELDAIEGYSWTFNLDDGAPLNTSSTDLSLNFPYEGLYYGQMIVNPGLFCPDTALVEVDVFPVPKAEFAYIPEQPTKLDNIRFVNLSEESDFYDWDFGDWGYSDQVEPELNISLPGVYEVDLFVENQYGCTDSISQEIRILPVFDIYVPNAFSPNDDFVNDTFRAYAACPLEDFKMKVFNRWGILVFESDDIEDSWDGYFNGERLNNGVFSWVITYFFEGRNRVKKGDVNIIR
jgi:gliding motility-associated-like protein